MRYRWKFAIMAILFGALMIRGQQAMNKHAVKAENDSAWGQNAGRGIDRLELRSLD